MSTRPMTEKELSDMMVSAFEEVNTPPELVYAFKKTGFMLSTTNRHLFRSEDLREWDRAIREYYRKHKPSGGSNASGSAGRK